jgi:4-hydroxybenzoate polyprenyltransferase
MSNPKLLHYIKIARFNRWPMNLLLIPGYLIALIDSHQISQIYNPIIIIALIALCCAAFANYTINEYLDAKFDALHPNKKNRPGAQGLLQLKYVLLEYFFLALLALSLAYCVNNTFLLLIFIFLLLGTAYNVSPIRTKDKPYLDILSESINNPLRFICGWFVISHPVIPPVSILLCCWMTGAFFMTMKRFAEFRHINNPKIIALYRKSFLYYDARKLLILAITFIFLACVFLATFLWEYKSITLLSFPFFVVLFTWYTRIGMLPNSPAQHPELLYRYQPAFVYYSLFVAIATMGLFFINTPP